MTIVITVLSRLQAFELPDSARQQTVVFSHGEDRLEGTLLLPSGISSPPVVLLVHGDAAQDRWSADGYLPLVNFLISRGIAVFSWDKPGVGSSRGNWLAQTMDDRADEAALALERLRTLPELYNSRLGFLGFSQAGWVVPRASRQSHADFAVLMGAAVNWRSQGLYFMRQRLLSEGVAADEIAKALADENEMFDAQYSPQTVSLPCLSRCNRQDFERRNALADAREDIRQMTTPVMLIMGEADRNVDPQESTEQWNATLPARTPRCLQQISDATHGLLRRGLFDYQLTTQWPWWKQGAFLMLGQEAYAPGGLETLADWIQLQQCRPE
nr:alpha/beta fold hydrolase [uncultured Erwinia sp.]